ncbi:MAG TPA: hypothetical protein VFU21_10260, partial [Kofleriaceae bacterium]|nr:hypothetical protein [Kofleriaceae bacterium]
SRVNKNPAIDKPGAKEAFLKRSVASQRGWQKRQTVASAPQARSSQKLKATKGKNKKVAAKKSDKSSSKKNSKKKADKKVAKAKGVKKGSKGGAAAADEAGMIANAGAGAKDFQNAVAKFEEAQFAAGEGRSRDAAVAQMEGHDFMAQSAFDAADAYEQAGRTDEAEKLNAFGEQHLAQADALEKKIDEQDKTATAQNAPQKRPGRIRRFFASLNPFKKDN